jgi:small ubiquitin-related modifier
MDAVHRKGGPAPSKKRGKKGAARPVEPSALEEALSTAEDPAGQPITIKVCAQNGKEISFGIKTTTKLGKVMQAFAVRMGMPIESLRFVLDGGRVNEGSTPQTLEMEDGDVIDCMLTFDGGGGGSKRAREEAGPHEYVHDTIRKPRWQVVHDLDSYPTEEERLSGWPNLKRAFGEELDNNERTQLDIAANAVEQSMMVATSLMERSNMDFESTSSANQFVLEVAKMIRLEILSSDKNYQQERAANAFESIGEAVEGMGKAALFAEKKRALRANAI